MYCLTVEAKLLCQECDSLGYTTYVFGLVDEKDIKLFGVRYLMCTRWPNWDHRELVNGEVGFLSFTEIIAGETQWYDGSTMNYYKYSCIQFNRFIQKQSDMKHEFKL